MISFFDAHSYLRECGPLVINQKRYLFAQANSKSENDNSNLSIHILNGVIDDKNSNDFVAEIKETDWTSKYNPNFRENYAYCKAIRRAVIEYVKRKEDFQHLEDLEFLNALKKSEKYPYTNKLIKLLSLNDILCGLRIFRLFTTVNEIIKTYYSPISHDEVARASIILKIETDHLVNILNNDTQISKRLSYKFISGPGRKIEWPYILFMVYFRKRLESENVKSRDFSIPSIYYFLNEQARSKYLETRSIYSKIKSYQSGRGLKKLKAVYNECQRQYITLLNEYSNDRMMTGVKAIRTITANHFQTKRDRLFPDWDDIIR
jgi:hypothetical protein